MDVLLSISFLVAGFLVIAFRKTLASLMYVYTQKPWTKFNEEFWQSVGGILGRLFGTWTRKADRWSIKVNTWGITFAGIVLIFMGLAALIGPISL
jgi:hypothetical protein